MSTQSVDLTPTPPSREIASPEYFKAIADGKEIAAMQLSAAEKNLKAAEWMKDVQAASEKNHKITQVQKKESAATSFRDVVESEYDTLSTDFDRDLHQTYRELVGVDLYFRELQRARGVEYKGPSTLKLGRKLGRLVKQADSWDTQDATGGGGTLGSQDWIMTGYQSIPIDIITLDPRVAGLFEIVRIPQGVGSVRVPVATSENTVSIVAEATDATTTGALWYQATVAPNTDFITLNPIKHRAGTVMSMEFQEDTVVNALAWAQAAIRRYLSLGLDSAIMNGQTTNQATLDGANGPTAANGYMSGLGGNNISLRHYSHVTNLNQVLAGGAPLDSGMIAEGRQKLRKNGVDPRECAIIPSAIAYLQLVADADDKVITLEKYGSAATILTGELARCYGMPVVPSDRLATNLGADGDAAATSTLTICMMVNHTRYRLGIARDIEVRIVPNPVADMVAAYGFMRTAFAPAPPTTDFHTVEIINIPTT